MQKFAVVFLAALLVFALAEEEYETKIAALKTQFSGDFDKLKQQVQDGVEQAKQKLNDPDVQAKLTDMKTKVEQAADSVKAKYQTQIDQVGASLKSWAENAKKTIAAKRDQVAAAAPATQQAAATGFFANIKNKMASWFDNQA